MNRLRASQRSPHTDRTLALAYVCGAFLVYVAAFVPLYTRFGVIAASLSTVPLVLAGLLFKRIGGLVAGLASIPLHVFLFGLVEPSGLEVVLRQWPGSVMGIIAGVSAGWLSTFLQRVREQARDLARERAVLQAEISERKRIETELQTARAAAESANEAKSVFLASVSHELRTPLTAILGYCELLELQLQQLDDQRALKDITHISQASQHLLSVINNILDLAKVESGKMDVYLDVFEIAPLCERIAALVRPLIQRNGNTLHVQIDDDVGDMLGDSNKVQQILVNLLGNAAKFTRDGHITLAVCRAREAECDCYEFAVTDTGIGIAEDAVERLFQPFTQSKQAVVYAEGGTGLGLALSQRLCALLGGSLSVESALGHGSTFRVRLPIIPPTAPQVPRLDDEQRPSRRAPQPQ